MDVTTLKYVAYYRVSTTQQQRSGLGLEAQQAAVQQYCNGSIIASFTDVESGKRSDNRPELHKAIDLCKGQSAVLIIAKLDRLSRNLVFIGQLMEARVQFKCCDMPEADSFTIHIFAAMAQKEREMISTRTKSALKSLKDRGIKLGNPKHSNVILKNENMAQARSARKKKVYDPKLLSEISHHKGHTLQFIANKLNELGYKTTKGHSFTPVQVFRLSSLTNVS